MENQRSDLSRILVQRIRHGCKVVFMTNSAVSLAWCGFRIRDERYFESEKGAHRALQAGYLAILIDRFSCYLNGGLIGIVSGLALIVLREMLREQGGDVHQNDVCLHV